MHDKDAATFKMVFPLPDKGWRFDIPGLILAMFMIRGLFLKLATISTRTLTTLV
jgi:hypothetical protein